MNNELLWVIFISIVACVCAWLVAAKEEKKRERARKEFKKFMDENYLSILDKK